MVASAAALIGTARRMLELLEARVDTGDASAGAPALALVEDRLSGGTTIFQPQPLPADESFRALNEFDAERSELFLVRGASGRGAHGEARLPVHLPLARLRPRP